MKGEDGDLGLSREITRKDFLNGALLGVGALAGGQVPAGLIRALERGRRPFRQDDWTGYGGTGDYARSNGNTRGVLEGAHRIRGGEYADGVAAEAIDTGESYDLVIVGGGLSGLSAAWAFRNESPGGRCLVLDNHPIFGGEAKENEFVVDGVRLVAPQGSNQFGVPREGSGGLTDRIWTDLGLPREFAFEELDASAGELRIPLDNYAHMDGVNEFQVDIGYFFDESSGASRPTWVRNIWPADLEGTPFPADVRADLIRWRMTDVRLSQEQRRALDAMTYAQHLEGELGYHPEVTRYIAPIIGLISGASPDAVSAHAAAQIGMPGTGRARGRTGSLPRSFPGGNSTIARHFVKYLVPDAISGERTLDGVYDGRVDFAALDRGGNPVRIRTGATVLRVEHEGSGGNGSGVIVAWEKDGRVYRARARAAVLASGGWINRHICADMPAAIRAAYGEFLYAPAMVVNVALNDWRFMHRMGIAAARWFDDGFGFSCNIRRPMRVGAQPVPLHPDRPAVLTFYMGLWQAGLSVREQGVRGRETLLATPFAEWERKLRTRMNRLFGESGFDASRDIAGIILNRWGHARMVQPPGFYYGTGGRQSPREIVEEGWGRIVIGHSELNGHQNMSGAMARGSQAVERALSLL